MSTRYRVCTWGNPTTGERKYGLQASVAPRMWLHVFEGKKVPLFDTAKEAKAEIARLQAKAEDAGAELATMPVEFRPIRPIPLAPA